MSPSSRIMANANKYIAAKRGFDEMRAAGDLSDAVHYQFMCSLHKAHNLDLPEAPA